MNHIIGENGTFVDGDDEFKRDRHGHVEVHDGHLPGLGAWRQEQRERDT